MGGKNQRKTKKSLKKEDAPDNYVVERIVDSRIIKGKSQYKVHWEGYTTDEETWENESQLDCPELLEEYLESVNENDTEELSTRDSPVKRRDIAPEKAEVPTSSKKKSRGKRDSEDEDEEDKPSPSSPTRQKGNQKKESVKNNTDEAEDDNDDPAADADDEYEVDQIIHDREYNGKKQYLVRWKGFAENDDTWEFEENLNCSDIIDKYLKNKKKTNGEPAKPPKKKSRVEDTTDTNDSDKNEEYEIERILDMHLFKDGVRTFLVKWVGFSSKDATWEPERNLEGTDILKKYLERVEKAKELPAKELRVSRKPTDRYASMSQSDRRRYSRRHANRQRVKYYDAE